MSERGEGGHAVESPQAVLENLLKMLALEGKVEVRKTAEGDTLLHIASPDPGRLIGREGQLLEALQLLVNRMTRREGETARHIIDVEGYRDRRKARVEEIAKEAAERVAKTGRAVTLPTMSAHDRRLVHQALREDGRVMTQSRVTDDDEKQVVVYPAEKGPMAKPPPPPDVDDNFGNR